LIKATKNNSTSGIETVIPLYISSKLFSIVDVYNWQYSRFALNAKLNFNILY
jgi:hypothetical protein